MWVDPAGWGEPGSSAADGDRPVGFLDFVVVEQAEQDPVVEVGSAAVEPGPDVVGLGPGWWPVTPRPRTPAVADVESGAQAAAEQPLAAAHVQREPGRGQPDRDDLGVIGEQPDK